MSGNYTRLAGCSVYAMGYKLDEGHDAGMARPALTDVLRLARKYREAEKQREDWLRVAENHADEMRKAWTAIGDEAHELEPLNEAVARVVKQRDEAVSLIQELVGEAPKKPGLTKRVVDFLATLSGSGVG